MRPSPLSCLTAGLFVAFALTVPTSIQAQGFPQLPRESLLLQEAVQTDLGLSEKQKSQINGLQASIGPKSRETFQSLQESGAEPQEFAETMAGLHREHQAALLRVLDKNQKTRYSQIQLQREGFLAAARSEIASKLKLSPTQTKKIKTIVGEMRQAQRRSMPAMLGQLQEGENGTPNSTPPTNQPSTTKAKKGASKSRRPAGNSNANPGVGNMEEMGIDGEFGAGLPTGPFPGGGFPGGGGPPGGLPDFLKPENQPDFAKMLEAQKQSRHEAGTKIGAVLTAEQKSAFEKLTGKPFDFTKIDGGQATPKSTEDAEPKAEPTEKKPEMPKAQPKTKKSSRA